MRTATQVNPSRNLGRQWSLLLFPFGVVAAIVCVLLAPHAAHGAADQSWPPFVLVAGLLLIGSVAAEDGVFTSAGDHLAGLFKSGVLTYVVAMGAVLLVTATLNLDTAVVFLTPVLIVTARRRGCGIAPFLYASVFMANASSLFLPGSNLTNLIVLAGRGESGGSFLALMAPAAIAASVATALGLTVWARKDLHGVGTLRGDVTSLRFGWGLMGVLAATVLSITLSSPALPVAIVGVFVVAIRMIQRRLNSRSAVEALGGPILLGLFGLAVAMGTLGRVWAYPSHVLLHAGAVETTAIASLATIVLNNLPATSLLAAHHSSHPAQLLLGLNVGPNLFATGSLAWFLWYRVASSNGARPSLGQATRLGIVLAPLAMAAALIGLWVA
jgi:arsenical pump membrane protein